MKDADIHRQFESLANGDVQIGELPEWLHVRGTCAWYVYQGPYSGLGNARQTFMGRSMRRDCRARARVGTSMSAIPESIRPTAGRR